MVWATVLDAEDAETGRLMVKMPKGNSGKVKNRLRVGVDTRRVEIGFR